MITNVVDELVQYIIDIEFCSVFLFSIKPNCTVHSFTIIQTYCSAEHVQ